MTPISHDVLVAGAGSGGLATAISAARHGASVLVVERRAGPSDLPRATVLSSRSMEVLRSWGLADRVRPASGPTSLTISVSRTLSDADPEVLPLVRHPAGLDSATFTPEPAVLMPQDHLEPLLIEHLRNLGGEIRFSAQLTGLDLRPDGVAATVGGERVAARFVVGADGARSAVRAAAGIGVRTLGELGPVLQATFRADLDRPAHALSFVDGGVVVAAGAGRWVYMWNQPPGETPTDWPVERVVEHIRTAAGRPDLAVDVQATMPVTLAAELAESVRAGRIFLVGDAAHRTTPIGGVGMNTALQDGHNLGWKLAWAARGWAGADLLDSYAQEREPIGARNARRSLQTDGPTEVDDLTADLGNRYRSAVFDDATAGASLDFAARTGERAPHAWLDGRSRSTLDLLGDGLTLLTGRRGDPWRRAAAEFAGPAVSVVTALAARPFRITDDGAVLVRPDGFVAWRCDRADDVPRALAAAVAMSVGRPVPSPAACGESAAQIA